MANNSSLTIQNSEYIIKINNQHIVTFSESSFSKETAEEVFNAIVGSYMLGQDESSSQDTYSMSDNS